MTEQPAPFPADGPTGEVTSTGMDPHVAGLLTYMFGWITGLIFFLIEKTHREVRFHAAQSLLLSIALAVVWIALAVISSFMPFPISLIIGLVELLLGLASFALWIFLMIQGYQLKHFKLPVIGDMAEQWAAK
ncbi:MAG: DUF4870 domain-containing protein [Mycobacteriaceae bacterium]